MLHCDLSNTLSLLFQNNNDQLELISTLVEKHKLKAKENTYRKTEIWNKIAVDFYESSKLKRTAKFLMKKWDNKMNTLRGWERAIRYSKKRTGKKESDHSDLQ